MSTMPTQQYSDMPENEMISSTVLRSIDALLRDLVYLSVTTGVS